MDARPTSADADWLSAQQKYWDAWLELTRRALQHSDTDPPRAPAAEPLLKWWEAVAVAAPPQTGDLFERLVRLSQPYFEMAEAFAADSARDARTALDQWLDRMEQALSAKRESAGAAPAEGPYRAASALWELPLENWERGLAAVAPLAADLYAAHGVRGLKDRTDRLLAAPAVGYVRETQERYQRLMRLQLEYLEALQAYSLAFTRVAARSIEAFRAALERTAPPPQSLRRLYDLWVDACEQAYREYAASEEYARLYARLVNALAALKQQAAIVMDEVLESLNLPTRREIDSMHRHIHRARRENQALRAELEQLKRRLAPAAAEPAPPRPRRKRKHH